MKSIEEMIQELPPEYRKQVEDFVQFLLGKQARKRPGQLQLDWRGALRDLRGQCTSVQLQHKALES